MNCHACEELFDAYIDGALRGSLRLEFDAHLLRCRHCQQTLAMLEALGHVIATDDRAPAVSTDFTDRVMQTIAAQPRKIPLWRRRPVLSSAVVVANVAAALAIGAVLFRPSPPPAPAVVRVDPAKAAGIRELIVERVEDRLWEMHSAGRQVTSEAVQLAQYLNITLPEDIVRDSVNVVDRDPLLNLFQAIVPAPAETHEPASGAPEQFSL